MLFYAINALSNARFGAACVVHKIPRWQGREFVVLRLDQIDRGRARMLHEQLDEFASIRNRMCHDGEVHDVNHSKFQRLGSDIHDVLIELDSIVS